RLVRVGGPVERRPATVIRLIDVGSGLEEQVHEAPVLPIRLARGSSRDARRQVQERVSVGAAGEGEVGVEAEEARETLAIAAFQGFEGGDEGLGSLVVG